MPFEKFCKCRLWFRPESQSLLAKKMLINSLGKEKTAINDSVLSRKSHLWLKACFVLERFGGLEWSSENLYLTSLLYHFLPLPQEKITAGDSQRDYFCLLKGSHDSSLIWGEKSHKCVQPFWKTDWQFHPKLNILLTMWPCKHTPWYLYEWFKPSNLMVFTQMS